MLRRTVFAVVLTLSIWSVALCRAAEAQPPGKVYRIGVLSLTSFEGTTLATVTVQGLSKLGYVVGRNIIVEDKFADGHADRLPALAAEHVRVNVDVIVAGHTSAVRGSRCDEHDSDRDVVCRRGSGQDRLRDQPGATRWHVTGVTAVARDLAPKTTIPQSLLQRADACQ